MKNHNDTMSFRVTKDLREGLEQMAAEKNITISELVRQILLQSVDQSVEGK
jgi:predicted HicB family RNase H-like nuclease